MTSQQMKAISVGICGAELKSFGVEWQGKVQRHIFTLFQEMSEEKAKMFSTYSVIKKYYCFGLLLQ